MSAVHRITRPARGPTVGEAVAAYLATLDHPESAGTRRVYAATLRALRTAFDAQTPLVVLAEPAQVQTLTVWFEQSWGHKAAATYNRNLDALRSALHYWSDQDWIIWKNIRPTAVEVSMP